MCVLCVSACVSVFLCPLTCAAHGRIADAPEDKSITTIYLGGIVPEITEQDIKFVSVSLCTHVFVCMSYQAQGPLLPVWGDPVCDHHPETVCWLRRVRHVCLVLLVSVCHYCRRTAAEEAMRNALNHLGIKGHTLKVMWGRSRAQSLVVPTAATPSGVSEAPVIPGLPGPVPFPSQYAVCLCCVDSVDV